MQRRLTFALGGATLALALTPAAALAATRGGTPVTVRVEGLNKTLLAPKAVKAPKSGSITKGGTPRGQCPANSAAGALDVATHHHWGGTYASGLGIELTRIFSETHLFTSKDYWSVWVGNGYAQTGMCGVKLHPGEHLLFAAVPVTFKGSLLALKAPGSATAGSAFKVTVYKVSSKGKRTPLAHAHVTGRGVNATTNGQGIATVDPSKAGTLTLQASHTGDIRSAPETVRVG